MASPTPTKRSADSAAFISISPPKEVMDNHRKLRLIYARESVRVTGWIRKSGSADSTGCEATCTHSSGGARTSMLLVDTHPLVQGFARYPHAVCSPDEWSLSSLAIRLGAQVQLSLFLGQIRGLPTQHAASARALTRIVDEGTGLSSPVPGATSAAIRASHRRLLACLDAG